MKNQSNNINLSLINKDPYLKKNLEIYNSLPGSLCWKDLKGYYIWHNPQYLISIRSNQTILGKNDKQLWPNNCEEIAKNDQTVLSSDKIHSFEETLSINDQEICLITTKTPLKNQYNETVGIIASIIPINNIENCHTYSCQEIKKIEKNNMLSNHYLRNIIESVPGSIYWKDKDGIWIGANTHTFLATGISSENLLGKTDYELWPEQAEELRENDIKVMTTGCTLSKEESVILPNGEKKYYAAEKMPLRDMSGNVIGIIGNSIDITKLKETQKELEKAKISAEAGERAKSEFISNVSHDMRTPLSGIVSLAHQLEDSLDDGELKKIISQIGSSGDALLNMFIEILDNVSAESMAEDNVEYEVFDINRIINDVEKLERPSITNKKIDLIYEIDPQVPPYLIGDGKKIHRIILNLVGNAIKFTQKGYIKIKIVLIKKHENNIKIRIDVIDTGIGISDENKKRLFEKFYKLSPSFKTEYKGFGLGLHIAKTYTHLLGGEINLTSQIGSGSDFYVILPLKEASEKDIERYKTKLNEKKSSLLKVAVTDKPELKNLEFKLKPHKKPDNTTKYCYHILVVEDNEIARVMLINHIKAAELRYTEADNGETALELAKNNNFDLILTDVGLPGISGTEFTVQLRQFEKEKNKNPVPIVGVTAHTANGRNECLDAGMSAVTNKPLSKDTFIEILQEFLFFYKS